MSRTRFGVVATGWFLAMAPICGAAADDPADEQRRPATSLDDQLFQGLDNDLLEGLGDIPARPVPSRGDDEPPQRRQTGFDDRPAEQPDGASTDPLTRIGQQMQAVRELIEAKDTSAGTQNLQMKIIDQLAALIDEAQKQCAGGQRSGPPTPGRPADEPGGGGGLDGDQPAQQSTPRLGKSNPEATVADAPAVGELFKQAWGHLPERVRREMQNVTVERFLPKYQALIEQYYKRLAEEGHNQP